MDKSIKSSTRRSHGKTSIQHIQLSAAEILTVAVVAAKYFQNHHEQQPAIGLHVASTQPHELTRAEPTLQTIREQGRSKTHPKELVADKAYDTVQSFARACGDVGSSRLFPPMSGVHARSPNAGVRCVPEQAIASVGRWNGASVGWTTVVVWWCVMSVICIYTKPSALSPSFYGALIEF